MLTKGLTGKLGLICVSLFVIGLSILGALPNADRQPTQSPEAQTSSPVATVLSSGPPFVDPVAVAVSPNGQTLYITDYGANAVFNLTTTGGTPTLIASGPDFVGLRGITRSPDGTTLYAAGFQNGQIISLPAKGGSSTILASGSPLVHPHGIAVSPDGKTLYIADNFAGSVLSLPVSGGSPTVLASGAPFGNSGTGFDTPNGISVSHDGSTLFIAAGTSGIYSLPVTGGTPHLITSGPTSQVWVSPVLSADGTTLFVMDAVSTTCGCGPGIIYSLPAGGGSPTLFFQGSPLTSAGLMSLSPDGHGLFVANAAGIVGQPGSVFKLDVNIPSSCVTPASGLVSWWPGDGNAIDIIGNHNGALVNGATFVPGLVQQAFSLNGVNQFVNVTNDPAWNFGTNPFTIELWVNFNQVPGHDAFVSHDEGPNNLNKWFFGLNPFPTDAGLLSFHINGPVIGPISIVTAPWTPNLNQWYHVAVTRAADAYALYIDGANVANATNTTPIPAASAPLKIGSSEGSFFHNGPIDEVSIYNRSLDRAEIRGIFNAGSAGKCKPSCIQAAPGIVSWWAGEGNAKDSVGSNLGILKGGVSFASGIVGQAFNLSGIDGNIQIQDSPSLNPTNAITVAAWYKPTVSFVGDGTNSIVDKGYLTHSDPYYQYHLSVDGDQYLAGSGPGHFGFEVSTSTGGRVGAGTGPNFWSLGHWYYLVGTYDGSAVNLYVNGTLIKSSPLTGTMVDYGKNVSIGGFSNINRPNVDYTPGLIDEVQIYNRSLTSSEIQSIFTAVSTGKCPCVTPPRGLVSWWPGDANANDIIGPNSGTLVGGVTFVPGKVGQAFSFDGIDGYVRNANAQNIPTVGPFTVDAWIKYNSSDPAGVNPEVVTIGGSTFCPSGGIHAIVLPGKTGVSIARGCNATPNFDCGVANVGVGDNNWHYVATSWNGTYSSVYIDGELRNQCPGTEYTRSTNYVSIGGRYDQDSVNAPYKGLVDEVQIYNRSLTASEIQAIFAAGSSGCCKPTADFSLTPTSTIVSFAAASMGSDNLGVDSINGFTGTITFTRVASPFGGVSYFCSDVILSSTVTSATSTCTFSSSSPGTFIAIVNGTGGTPSVSHQVTYTVIVVKNTPSIHTTLSTSTITVGGSVTDSATLTGTDTLTASGTVTYEFFTGSTCAGTATIAGPPVVVNGGVVPTSAAQTFNSAGLFGWKAVYSGDANNNGATSLCEPLQVNPLTGVAVTTKLSATTISVGGSVSDSATLSGVTSTAGGTVIYHLFNTGDCSSPVIVVGTVDVSNGVVPDSPLKTFSTPGLFGWNAAYSGDANNGGANSICEPLTVTKASPTLSTTLSATTITVGGSVSDTATLAGGFTPTGAVSFSFYSGDCSSGIVTIILPPVSLVGSSATSAYQAFNSAGSFSWKAVYLGDSNNNPVTSPCEPLTVDKASPTVSTSLSATTVIVGGTAVDSAALTGSFHAGGTATYSIFGNAVCTAPGTVVSTVMVIGSVVPSSRAVTFNSTGSFSFNGVYSGDSNNNGATSSCETLSIVEAAGFTMSASPTSLTVAPGEARSCEGQGSAQRCDDEGSSTITVTGLNRFSGTVTLTVSTSPNLSVSLSTATITGSGSSTLTVSEGKPGNYTVTVTGTSGSIIRSVVVNVMVRPPAPLKCGGDSDCKIESDAPLSDVRFGDKKIHFTVDGTAGARGAVNVTIPRSAVPDIDRIEVSVDGAKQPRSALMIASDDSNYHVYFSFTFHSPVAIDIDLAPAVTILGLAPLAFYGIVGGGIAIVVVAGILTLVRRGRTAKQQLIQKV